MMNYEQFICAMLDCTNQKLPDNAHAERQEILKNNGVKNVGLVLQRKDEPVAPLVYLEEFYQRYLRGASVEALADSLIRFCENAPGAPAWDYHNFLDFQKVKDHIVYKLVHAKENGELLKEVPHLPLMDLAIVFYVLVPAENAEGCSILVRNSHLREWKLPVSFLYEYAKKNTPKLCPHRFCPLDNFVKEITGENAVFVLTNERGVNGAAAILYPGVPEMICEVLGENYYLIPSSIHEFIIVPDRGQISPEELGEMLRETNAAEVPEEEVLSDHIYYFDGNIITEI